MRRFLALLLLLFAVLGGASAAASSFEPLAEPFDLASPDGGTLLPYFDEASARYGYMNDLGEGVIAPAYEEAGRFVHGLARVKKDDLYGYIGTDGRMLIPNVFEYAEDFGAQTGLAHVRYLGPDAVINTKGEIFAGLDAVHPAEDAMVRIEQGGLFGYLGADGLIIAPQWMDASDFSGGYASVMTDQEPRRYGYINKTGRLVLKGYEFAGQFKDGLTWVRLGSLSGFINDKSVLVLDAPAEGMALAGFSCDRALSSENADGGAPYCYIDRAGQLAFDGHFDSAESFVDGLARVQKDGKWGVIDVSGRAVVAFEYDEIAATSEGLMAAKKDGKYGYVNLGGELVIAPKYDQAAGFVDGFALVSLGGVTMPIDARGEPLAHISAAEKAPTPTHSIFVDDLGDVSESSPTPGPTPEPTPEPSSSGSIFVDDDVFDGEGTAASPEATAAPTAAPAATAITRKTKGAQKTIQQMQLALIEKGYLTGRADGGFGVKTERALVWYQELNGLKISGIFDEPTMASLTAGQGQQAGIPLVFGPAPASDWKKRGNSYQFRVQLCNVSYEDTITAYELGYYLVDESGARQPESGFAHLSFETKMKPSTAVYSGAITLDDPVPGQKLFLGIRSVQLLSGETIEMDEGNMRLFDWDLP